MRRSNGFVRFALSILILSTTSAVAFAQRQAAEFGPVVSAYLGYLNNEQEVVDDRASRREITPAYYRRNSSRIHALRETAVRLARQSGNDYVPELEAVAGDEFRTIFERPPHSTTLRPNEIIDNKFRFLGAVHTGETFYVFARLDPYEQAELMKKVSKPDGSSAGAGNRQTSNETTRARRVIPR